MSNFKINFFKDEEIEELSIKPDSQDTGEKRKLSVETPPPASAKKIILNRNSVIEEIKVDDVKKNNDDSKDSSDGQQPEKKIIKLSELGVKERLEMRAKKFGVSLNEAGKKEARSARFNLTTTNDSNGKSAASVKTPVVKLINYYSIF